ncbi:MAG: hypothetical protein RQ757_12465 [Pseudomonadales bacterium]|nr:hypothetical protein [Pseudomonadales bacterium]
MGTVVTFAMLFGAIALFAVNRLSKPLRQGIGVAVLLLGLWNVLWYGLRHLGEFWGHAALASGIAMLFAATLILIEAGMLRLATPPRTIRLIIIAALLASLLLYGITIIQIGLGYEIIG